MTYTDPDTGTAFASFHDYKSEAHTFPVIECFGPTIQGEGALAGLPTLFVRFGGCDYRCSWCDTPYAVFPDQVRANATKMTVQEIVEACKRLARSPGLYVTLSGGNPALMRFDDGANNLPQLLHNCGYKTSVETQGSIWRNWLANVTHLTVSPKPPSSEMATEENRLETDRFLSKAETYVAEGERSIKIVCFDDEDYAWARDLIVERRGLGWQMFLSAGTTPTATSITRRDLLDDVCDRYGWLCNKVAADPELTSVKVLPQLHVLAFGAGRGV